MQIKIRYLVIGVIIAFILGCLYAAVLRGREIRDYRERVESIERDLSAARTAQWQATERIDELERKLAEARRRISDAERRAREAQKRLGRITSHVESIGTEIDASLGTASESAELIDAGRKILQGVQERGGISD